VVNFAQREGKGLKKIGDRKDSIRGARGKSRNIKSQWEEPTRQKGAQGTRHEMGDWRDITKIRNKREKPSKKKHGERPCLPCAPDLKQDSKEKG